MTLSLSDSRTVDGLQQSSGYVCYWHFIVTVIVP